MKRILTLLALIVIVVIIVFVSKGNNLTGVWECTSYALLDNQDQTWIEQGSDFRDMFELKILDDKKIIVSTLGNENEGTYTVNGDTLIITIKENKTHYLHDKNTLTLVNHPRAKIVYTKAEKPTKE
ncbi:MAG: hypothetical protein K9N05_02005 [Candidatus Marinimicrobia bacterium]|nr:hypothetical protein [Candidatus Neomarinimicrobiota bacterium]